MDRSGPAGGPSPGGGTGLAMTRQLQGGIDLENDSTTGLPRPPVAGSLLFLRCDPDASNAIIFRTLLNLWNRWTLLSRGELPQLSGFPVPTSGLCFHLGYGHRFLSRPGLGGCAPEDSGPKHLFRSPLPGGGGPLLHGSGLRYDRDITVNPATEDFVVQFLADHPLMAHRAVVETSRALAYFRDPQWPANEPPPLAITAINTSFGRDDGRSWLDFHDGLSNLNGPEERRAAITIKASGDEGAAWTLGGTYGAFLRLAIDIAAWDRLDRKTQELMIGRDKLTGAPLVSLTPEGNPIAIDRCPMSGARAVLPGQPVPPSFREPPPVMEQALRESHIQRSNHHRGDPGRRDSLRIFRQSLDFLEPARDGFGWRAGMQFIAFMDTPERLFRMLTQPGWLGRVNFGGDPANQPAGMADLLTVRSAGIYLLPPLVEGEPFPGSILFSKMEIRT